MDEMLRIGVDPGKNGGIAYSFLGKTYAVKMPPTDFDVVAFLAALSKQSRLVELYLEAPSTGGWGPASKHSVGLLQFNVGVIYGAAVALGFGVWLILGSAQEFVTRVRRGRLSTIPRAAIGMTISHAALGVVGRWPLVVGRTWPRASVPALP